MNNRSKHIMKNFSYSFLANAINMLLSVVLVLIVPKRLGVREYAYWQLYVFYTSYVGFFHFGWADGIYLRFGGKKYESLDKNYFGTQFWLLAFMEIIIAVFVGIGACVFIPNADRQLILIMTGVCCVIQLPRTLLQYLLQTTNRITDYAKNFMLEKVVYAVLVVGMLAFGVRRYEPLLFADLISKTVTLLLLCVACKDIVSQRIQNIAVGIKEAWVNISVGCKLMFANIASMLITGIVRFAVQNHWDIETFGKVSLTMTVSNMLMVFIGAVSVVIYPLLKNTKEERLPEIYSTLRTLLMVPVLGMLVVYYPAKVLLSAWLPQYADSLTYMALLFPMCVYESKMSMLVNTYLKALRKEKTILLVNCCTVLLGLALTGIFVYFLNNLTLSIAALPIFLGIRCTLAELILAKKLKIKVIGDVVKEWVLTIIFMVSGWNMRSWGCVAVYGCAYALYLLSKRAEIKIVWKHVLCKVRNKEE